MKSPFLLFSIGALRALAKRHCVRCFSADWHSQNPSSSSIQNPATLYGEAIFQTLWLVSTIQSIAGQLRYESSGRSTYPMWDRKFRHSIRPGGHAGFLIPYHDYLDTTGDAEEDSRRLELLDEIAVTPELSHTAAF